MNKINLENLAEFFGTTRQTIARWKKEENKPVIDFVYKYLDNDLIEEFLHKGEILRLEELKAAPQGVLSQTISREVLNYYRNIDTSVGIILCDFLGETKYKILFPELDYCIINIEKVKDHFYDELTIFLHKNKNKYSVKERRIVNEFGSIILNEDEIHIYYYLKFIELVKKDELKKLNMEIENFGLKKALINKFFNTKGGK